MLLRSPPRRTQYMRNGTSCFAPCTNGVNARRVMLNEPEESRVCAIDARAYILESMSRAADGAEKSFYEASARMLVWQSRRSGMSSHSNAENAAKKAGARCCRRRSGASHHYPRHRAVWQMGKVRAAPGATLCMVCSTMNSAIDICAARKQSA